jgi:phosphoribosylanthranilate isomerase
LFLAGGLTPENVGQAIDEVSPFGLDVCSGVRTDGKLDRTKLKRFFAAVRNAGAQ